MKAAYYSYFLLIKNKKVKGSGEDPKLLMYSEPVKESIGDYKLKWIQKFVPSGIQILIYDID
jgi:hypothetical protein